MIANKAKYNTASGLASSSLELSTNLASQSSLVGHSQDPDSGPESRPSPTVHKGLSMSMFPIFFPLCFLDFSRTHINLSFLLSKYV